MKERIFEHNGKRYKVNVVNITGWSEEKRAREFYVPELGLNELLSKYEFGEKMDLTLSKVDSLIMFHGLTCARDNKNKDIQIYIPPISIVKFMYSISEPEDEKLKSILLKRGYSEVDLMVERGLMKNLESI